MSTTDQIDTTIPKSSQELVEKLRRALKRDGDFPASAKIVGELKQLTSDPRTSASQITELILQEPSLGPRILHLVNSAFYRRGKPVVTISQAVVQVGMRPLAELCSGLVLLQKFVPTARQGGAFASCLQRTVITSLVTSSIANKSNETGAKNEAGYLAGSLAELGTLLLAYYFPKVYESVLKRAETRKQEFSKSLLEVTGMTSSQLSVLVIDALELPPFYREILLASEQIGARASPQVAANDKAQVSTVARSLVAARRISEAIVAGKDRNYIDGVIADLKEKLGIDSTLLKETLGKLPSAFNDHCGALEVALPELPSYLSNYSASVPDASVTAEDAEKGEKALAFLDELRQAVENHEPTASVITSAAEALAWGLKFDRVLLLLVNQANRTMSGRIFLGDQSGVDPRSISRSLVSDTASRQPELNAFFQGRVIFSGNSLLPNGWPLVAIPVGFTPKTIGVIYADRTKDTTDLTEQEKASIAIISELLDRAVARN